MSVSDPLLKKLKGFIYELRTGEGPVEDENTYLKPLCETIEEILRKGLKTSGMFRLSKKDYWHWIDSLPNNSNIRVNPIFSMAVEYVRSSKKLKTAQGRGRLFIRSALQKKVLSVPLEQILKNQKLLEQWYDPTESILHNEILSEILMSLLFEATEIQFDLNTRNSSFLDETWYISWRREYKFVLMRIDVTKMYLLFLQRYRDYEFVPCDNLGVHVNYISNRAFVIAVDENSVASEYHRIQPGDILDELYGEALKGVKQGRIPSLLRQNKGWPITLSVIKCKYKDGRLFPPIAEMLRCMDTDLPSLSSIIKHARENKDKVDLNKKPPHAVLPEDGYKDVPIQTPESRARYRVQYVGKTHVGQDGSMCQIENAVATVLSNNPDHRFYQDVDVELGETEVITTIVETNQEKLRHAYPLISSCGRREDSSQYFGYIAGETTCTMSKDFICYVFKANCDNEARILLCGIAQGFGRTHWFV
ncbi:uncharacterized protein LOC106177605 [Lingula anatina]|uniref:Uncharacterized protein LOC106177605 n=1 Tax=Lingula anatina TaxID=7574 RepID=A0A1S3K0T3_LINAN|nr:uncharacterized protein LOC106177605 [Lingula anatina]|eukprot:XP_013415891.1 uncharacterized protein LOC106177605 [Lingula anatina]